MRKLLVLILLPLAFLLAACGATSGVVTDKTHTEGFYMVTYYTCGKSMCPMLTYIPPSWSVIVRQDSDGKTKASDVSETMYNTCQIGSQWIRSTTKDDGYCRTQ